MEQLTRQEIDGLTRLAHGLDASTTGAALWAGRAVSSAALPADGPHVDANPQGIADGPVLGSSLMDAPLMVGLERRLARRAEALWERLRADRSLPPAEAVGAFLAPPFAAHAMLVSVPPSGRPARISCVGEELLKLQIVSAGDLAAVESPAAPLGCQLVALALRAAETGLPLPFGSETSPMRTGNRQSAPLLLRAIALPFSAAAGARPQVVVITTWRELLSPDETEALHRELAAAIDWMHANRP